MEELFVQKEGRQKIEEIQSKEIYIFIMIEFIHSSDTINYEREKTNADAQNCKT